ncbi:MAG: VWA domain-containing protein [Planctomycetes bacterium]|nr:VWA domain-containing protein [Planctomycetota bacterium]
MDLRWIARALNAGALLCLVIALTPWGRSSGDALRLVVLVDQSRSVTADPGSDAPILAAALDPYLRRLRRDSRVWLAAYARNPVPWGGPVEPRATRAALESGPPVPRVEADPWAWSSRPDRALAHSEAVLGQAPGGAVLLVTDGRGVNLAAHRAAASLASLGHRLFTLDSPTAAPPGDLFLDGVEAPLRVSPGAPIRLRVHIGGTGRRERPFQLVVREDRAADPGAEIPGEWPGNGTAALDLSFAGSAAEEIRTFSVRLEEPDAPAHCRNTAADRLQISVAIGAPVRVLWAGTDAAPPHALGELGTGFGVVIGPLEDDALAAADVVVLEETPFGPPPVTAAAAERLDQAVRAGVGLVALGTRLAFGPGGWSRTTLERMLPLRTDRPGGRLDALLLLDRSGSVATGDRWARTVGAARLFVTSLEAEDRIRVSTFAAGTEVALDWRTITARDPAAMAQIEAELAMALGRQRPHGPTNLVAAVEQELRQFSRRADAREEDRRRLVVLSDGRLGEPLAAYRTLGSALRQAGIEVAAVATGDSLEPSGRNRLAALTLDGANGRVTEISHDEELAWAFRRSATPEWWLPGPVAVQRVGTVGAGELELPSPLPALGRVVRTRRQDTGEVVVTGPEELPVLAVGRHGEGRTVAFAGSLRDAGSEGWNHAAPWRGLLRWLARRGPDAGAAVVGRIRVRRDRMEVEAVLPEGESPAGWQVSIGRETRALAPLDAGRVGVCLDDPGGELSHGELLRGGRRRALLPVQRDPGEELREIGCFEPGLRAPADSGRGRRLEGADGPGWPPPPAGGGQRRPAPFWPLAALVLFLASRGVKSLRIPGR